MSGVYLSAVVATVLNDPLHLLMHQLHTAQTGLLQTLHLPLHQQLKRHLRHEQSRTWTLKKHTRTTSEMHFFVQSSKICLMLDYLL